MNIIKTLAQNVVPTVSALMVKETEERMKNVYAQVYIITDRIIIICYFAYFQVAKYHR